MSILTGGHTGSGSASNNPWAAPNANSASSLTWYYYHETKTFAPGPKLLLGRRYHGSATIVDQVTKAKMPIVTAGYHHTFLSSTELLINGKWQAGIIECKKQNNLLCNLFNIMVIRVVEFSNGGIQN